MGIIEKIRLDGKRGFVTGAARGIGKCTATVFAEAEAGSAGEQHQSGIHRDGADAQLFDSCSADREVERDGAPGAHGKAGGAAVHLRVSGGRYEHVYHRRGLCC